MWLPGLSVTLRTLVKITSHSSLLRLLAGFEGDFPSCFFGAEVVFLLSALPRPLVVLKGDFPNVFSGAESLSPENKIF